MQPLVSVIIPTKNSSRTLVNCLESIKNQSYKNIEIIIVDNFSTDGTYEIAKKYSEKSYQKWPERTTQKNYGIGEAIGEYLCFIDGDMSLDMQSISDCVRKAQVSKNVWWVVLPVIDTGSSFWTKVIAFERSFYKWTEIEAARFLKSDLVRKVGGFKDIIFYEEFIVPQEIARLWYNVKIYTEYNIYHDYNDFTFLWNLKKKFYYGKSLHLYKKQMQYLWLSKSEGNQTWIFHRYMIFLRNPRFYTRPILAFCVLTLKTMEFAAGGIGLLFSKFR